MPPVDCLFSFRHNSRRMIFPLATHIELLRAVVTEWRVVSEDTFAFGSLPIGQAIYAMTLTGKSSRAKPTRFGLSTIRRLPKEALHLTRRAGTLGNFAATRRGRCAWSLSGCSLWNKKHIMKMM